MKLDQPGLFDQPTYPETPGFQPRATSRAAAEEMKEKAPTLREQVLELLKTRNLTADECAAELELSVLSIRPRVTELSRLGKIFDSGITRKNASDKNAIVWTACRSGVDQ